MNDDLKSRREQLNTALSSSDWARNLRRSTRYLIIIVVADIIFSVVLAFGLGQQHQQARREHAQALALQRAFARLSVLTRQIEVNTESAAHACASINDLRKKTLDLWEPLLLKPQPNQTHEQEQQAIAFRKRLETGFALEDCSKLQLEGNP